MTDKDLDIVKRLEKKAAMIQLEALGERFTPSSLFPLGELAKLIHEAANEIKRLRIIEAGYELLEKDLDGLWNAYNQK